HMTINAVTRLRESVTTIARSEDLLKHSINFAWSPGHESRRRNIMRQRVLGLTAMAAFISVAPSCIGAQTAAQNNGKRYCSNWVAWHDSQPTKKATLHVKGDCTFPTTGYTVKLK